MIAPASPSDEQIQAEFKRLLPELSSRLRYRFYENGPDLQAEYTAEGVALGWELFRSARRRGKMITAGNVGWYVIRAVLAGRRLAGSTSTDAMSVRAQKAVGTTVSIDADNNIYELIVGRKTCWPIVDLVAAKVDWSEFMETCDDRDKTIVAARLQGHMQTEIAAELGVSPPAVSQRLQSLRERWAALSAA